MLIRLQLVFASCAAVGMALGAVGLTLAAAGQEREAHEAQATAQTISQKASSLLVLTHEYALEGRSEIAQQWRQQFDEISLALVQQPTADSPQPLTRLRTVAPGLSRLFAQLEPLGQSVDDAAIARRRLVVGEVLSSAQSMAEDAHDWWKETARVRDMTEQRFQLIAVGAPLAMALAVLLGVWILRRSILRPLNILNTATDAIAAGDFSIRIGTDRSDEFGALKRKFDLMTTALATGHAQLDRSERQLRAMTDNIPALIAYLDSDEVYRFANGYYRTVYGIEPESLLGRSLKDHLGEASYAEVKPNVQAALRGERLSYERHATQRGLDRYFQIDYIPDTDAGGVSGTYVMVQDISGRKRAEFAQERSERLLRLMASHLPCLISYVGLDGRFRFANEQYRRNFGVDPAAMIGATIEEALGADTAQAVLPFVERALQGQPQRLERKVERAGKVFYLQSDYIPDVADDGSVLGIFAMAVDVTALKEAQFAHADGEKRLRTITDNLPVLISYVDTQQRFTFVNETYRTWLGFDPDSLLGRHLRDAMGDTLYAPRQPFLERALAGERLEYETAAVTSEGPRSMHTVYVPDLDDTGAVRGLYALSSDVTALKEAEQKLQALVRSDPLTDLPNRLSFNEKFPEAIARQERNADCLAVLFLDIDKFKSINDTLGHAIGDAVLKEFAQRLSACVRKTDTVARISGDEFVIILEGLHACEEASSVGQKIIAAIRMPFELGAQRLAVTTSIGIAYQSASVKAVTPQALLEFADKALYAAKHAGRDTYHVVEIA